jgi:hypothetical protein
MLRTCNSIPLSFGYSDVNLFDKMDPPRPERVGKWNSIKDLENTFFDILRRFMRVELQSLPKMLICAKSPFFSKNIRYRYGYD